MGAPFVNLWMRNREFYGQKRLGGETYNALKSNIPEKDRQINEKNPPSRLVREGGWGVCYEA